MISLLRASRALALVGTMVVAAALPTATPAVASCLLPLQVPPPGSDDTVVVVGTVVGIEGARTELEVVDWFMGAGPRSTVTVVGGRDPEVISSADWTPAIGDDYVVVATAGTDGILHTDLCQQRIVTSELLDILHQTYGDPRSALAGLVELANATDDLVTITISDASGTLVRATSGSPGDGASVPPRELVVMNQTPTSLRLTWAGGPCHAADSLTIDETGRRFVLEQPGCAGDSIVHDRVLILEFSEPIEAADVQGSLHESVDIPD